MQDRYVYPAVLSYAEDGISVAFPDLPGCLTCAPTEPEALDMAREALGLHLYGMEVDHDPIPAPVRALDVAVGPNQMVTLVDVWMPPLRDRIANRSTNKTVTLPQWLNRLAELHKVNFSHVLQEALKEHLGVRERR